MCQLKFHPDNPCPSCPYRVDVPLKQWNRDEFVKLVGADIQGFNPLFECHKKNGCICLGWLMMQLKNDIPSFYLRAKLSRDGISKEYIESLNCNAVMFGTTNEMILANYNGIDIADFESLDDQYNQMIDHGPRKN